jgi:site-specific recombinase XerD
VPDVAHATPELSAPTLNDVLVLARSFDLSLRARNRSPETIKSYVATVELFGGFLLVSGFPTSIDRIVREHVESFIADQLARWKPKTARIRYGNLQQFFKWCVEEGAITDTPMKNVRPPSVPEVPVPIISDDHLRRIFKSVEGTTFVQRRDAAILRVLYDCGVRLAEVTGLGVDDVDWDRQVIDVVGKGSRPRAVPFGAKTSQVLHRYLSARQVHLQSGSPALWLGAKGRLTDSGIAQMIRRRCRDAGVPHLHAHQFRHGAAHRWLASGGSEGDAMRLFGWRSRVMLERYGAVLADQRAYDAYRRLCPGDGL